MVVEPDVEARFERMESILEKLADNQLHLENALVTVVEAQTALAKAQARTEERFQQVAARFQELDERIDKLVSAIGELIRRIPPQNLVQ